MRVSEANRAGLPFWRATVGAFTHGDFTEGTRPGDPNDWRVFTFVSAAGARSI